MPAAIIAVTALLALPAASGGSGPVRSASSRTECCFVLTVRASGRISADYGQDYATQGRIGSEAYTWKWGTRELLEYSEYNGQPSLERPVNRHGTPTPSLRETSYWTAESDEAFVFDHTKSPTTQPCNQSAHIIADLQDTSFTNVLRLRNTDLPTRTRFAGHTYVLQLLTDPRVFGFNAPCLDSHAVGELEAPPLADGQPDEAHRPMGSRPYYLSLPPRAFLRQARGSKATATNHYAENLSFTHGVKGAAHNAGNEHQMVEQTEVTATFQWFPRSRLGRAVQRLKDEEATSDQ